VSFVVILQGAVTIHLLWSS